jgi:hypothetical protein
MAYLYTLTCCETSVDIHNDRESECGQCHSTFNVRAEDWESALLAEPFAADVLDASTAVILDAATPVGDTAREATARPYIGKRRA